MKILYKAKRHATWVVSELRGILYETKGYLITKTAHLGKKATRVMNKAKKKLTDRGNSFQRVFDQTDLA